MSSVGRFSGRVGATVRAPRFGVTLVILTSVFGIAVFAGNAFGRSSAQLPELQHGLPTCRLGVQPPLQRRLPHRLSACSVPQVSSSEPIFHAFQWSRHGGMVDLGTLGGADGFPLDQNAAGEVVGESMTRPGNWHAFAWTRQHGMADLGTLGGSFSVATAVNQAGMIAGWSSTTKKNADAHAFLWTRRHGMTDLGTLGGGQGCPIAEPHDISTRGEVIGQSYTPDCTPHAFLWTRRGGMVDLDPSGSLSSADAINTRGQIVGWRINENDEYRAVLWTRRGGMVDLVGKGGIGDQAIDVNDRGQVVGESVTPENYLGAFIWDRRDGLMDLGNLGGRGAIAWAVSDTGFVAGSSWLPGDVQTHAFRWTARDGMVDLGSLGGGSDAYDVNNSGQVAGYSYLVDGVTSHAFSWTPMSGMLDLGTLGPRGRSSTRSQSPTVGRRALRWGSAAITSRPLDRTSSSSTHSASTSHRANPSVVAARRPAIVGPLCSRRSRRLRVPESFRPRGRYGGWAIRLSGLLPAIQGGSRAATPQWANGPKPSRSPRKQAPNTPNRSGLASPPLCPVCRVTMRPTA